MYMWQLHNYTRHHTGRVFSPLLLCMALTHVLVSSILSNNIRKGGKFVRHVQKKSRRRPWTVGCAFEEMRMAVYLFEGEIRARPYYNLYSLMPNKRGQQIIGL